MIFPVEPNRSRVSDRRDQPAQLLDGCFGLVHLHIHPAQVQAGVVDVATLARLPVHDELPVVQRLTPDFLVDSSREMRWLTKRT